jgi:hypothetical protein
MSGSSGRALASARAWARLPTDWRSFSLPRTIDLPRDAQRRLAAYCPRPNTLVQDGILGQSSTLRLVAVASGP